MGLPPQTSGQPVRKVDRGILLRCASRIALHAMVTISNAGPFRKSATVRAPLPVMKLRADARARWAHQSTECATSRKLDTKTKELMALAISVTHGCDDCIAHHVHDAIDAGASRDEITDTHGGSLDGYSVVASDRMSARSLGPWSMRTERRTRPRPKMWPAKR